MAGNCEHLAQQATHLAATQRVFWDAWKGLQAEGRAGLPEARRAHVELEKAFVLARRTLYQAWFPRELPSVVDKTDYRQAGEYHMGFMETRDLIVNKDDSFYVNHVGSAGDSALYLWNQERTRKMIDVTQHLPERIVTAFVTTPDGKVIVATRDDSPRGSGVVYQLTVVADGSYTTQKELFRNDTSIQKIQPLYDGRILTGDRDGVLSLWTMGQDGVWERLFVGRQPSSMTSMQMMEDRRIVSGGELGDVVLWMPREEGGGYESRIVGWKNAAVNCLQGWHDGSVVAGYADGFILLTNPRPDGTCRMAFHNFRGAAVKCLQRISDDRIVVGLGDGEIILMGIVDESLRVVREIGRHSYSSSSDIGMRAQVQALQVMEDGRVYSIGDDRLVRVWDGEPVDSNNGDR